jgi:UDP-glucose 4-epimerase
MLLKDKSVLITGGTGSLGKVLVRRLLSGAHGTPRQIIVLSRDEAKQHYMRLDFEKLAQQTTETVIFDNFRRLLTFRVSDVRDYESVASALRGVDVVFNAAALKQVPTCEYFPYEAVRTNIAGPENIVRAIRNHGLDVDTVIGISTDKACKPVNVMGMTKAIQERVFITGNLYCPKTRFVCARYGNVLASRGSVIPLFHEQIARGGPITLTTTDMTRFLLSLEAAVDTIIEAAENGKPGDTFIPRVPAAKMTDVAQALIGERDIAVRVTGIRPGEKVHEILVSEEEAPRTFEHTADYYVIKPMLPELAQPGSTRGPARTTEYSSQEGLLSRQGVHDLLAKNDLLTGISEQARFGL